MSGVLRGDRTKRSVREVDPREDIAAVVNVPSSCTPASTVAPAAEVDRRRQRAGAGRSGDASTPIASGSAIAGSSLPFFNLQQVVGASVVELTLAAQAITAANAQGKEPPRRCSTLREAQDVIEIPKWSVYDPEGPLWFRGYAVWPEDTTPRRSTRSSIR